MRKLNGAVKRLRNYRVYHRWIGILLSFFIVISAGTGILLSLKKDIDILQPPSQKGVQKNLINTLSLNTIALLADSVFYSQFPNQSNNNIDRIDVRPNKGMAKVLYETGNWEIQIDLHSGAVLSIEKRYSDWIETLHDGSIISDGFKLISMNFLGWGLIIMIITGLWLYFGPKEIRKRRHSNKKNV